MDSNQEQEGKETLREAMSWSYSVAFGSFIGAPGAILRTAVTRESWSIPLELISLIKEDQFSGVECENPFSHVGRFLELCDTTHIEGLSEDALRLRVFPFSLRGRARAWYDALPRNSIATWEDMATKFLSKFFPLAKAARIRAEIANFHQSEDEALCDAWERLQDLLRQYPHHGYAKEIQLQFFYFGLQVDTRTLLDVAAGGSLLDKTIDGAYNLIEDMANNEAEWRDHRPTRVEVNSYGEDLSSKLKLLQSMDSDIQMEQMVINCAEELLTPREDIDDLVSEGCMVEQSSKEEEIENSCAALTKAPIFYVDDMEKAHEENSWVPKILMVDKSEIEEEQDAWCSEGLEKVMNILLYILTKPLEIQEKKVDPIWVEGKHLRDDLPKKILFYEPP